MTESIFSKELSQFKCMSLQTTWMYASGSVTGFLYIQYFVPTPLNILLHFMLITEKANVQIRQFSNIISCEG